MCGEVDKLMVQVVLRSKLINEVDLVLMIWSTTICKSLSF